MHCLIKLFLFEVPGHETLKKKLIKFVSKSLAIVILRKSGFEPISSDLK